jgi:hypothetical protein
MIRHPRFPDHIAVNHQTLPSHEQRVALTGVAAWRHGVCVECPERLCARSEDDLQYSHCLLSDTSTTKSMGVWITQTTYAIFKLHDGKVKALE